MYSPYLVRMPCRKVYMLNPKCPNRHVEKAIIPLYAYSWRLSHYRVDSSFIEPKFVCVINGFVTLYYLIASSVCADSLAQLILTGLCLAGERCLDRGEPAAWGAE